MAEAHDQETLDRFIDATGRLCLVAAAALDELEGQRAASNGPAVPDQHRDLLGPLCDRLERAIGAAGVEVIRAVRGGS